MEEAAEKLAQVSEMYRAKEEMARSTNRIFRIKNNPGFPVEINKKERTIEVDISNITNPIYIRFLVIFINNLILFGVSFIDV
jgi:hypothetical protein